MPDEQETRIPVRVAIPPGITPTFCRLENVEIADAQGRKIPYEV